MSNSEITQGMGSTDGVAILTGGEAGTSSSPPPSGGVGVDIMTGGLGFGDQITQGLGGVAGGGGDTTPPTAPSVIGAAIVAATVTITLTLAPGTDPGTTYNVYRDNAKIDSGQAGPYWSETVPANNTVHIYGASMTDAAGNEGPVALLTGTVAWTDAATAVAIRQEMDSHSTQLAAIRQALPSIFAAGTVEDIAPSGALFRGSTSLSAADNFYRGQFLVFVDSAALAPQAQEITGYIGASRQFTFATPFVGIPQDGDAFVILGNGA